MVPAQPALVAPDEPLDELPELPLLPPRRLESPPDPLLNEEKSGKLPLLLLPREERPLSPLDPDSSVVRSAALEA